jgi:choline dehydrogenase-like flavoprotein
VEVVTADWLPFGKRNLSFLAESEDGGKWPGIYLHAPAAAWRLDADASDSVRVRSVSARACGKTLVVHAHAFVLAAGAIETTRILLEMERRWGRPFREGTALGRYLADHLSCSVANVAERDWARCAEIFGSRFKEGRRRSFRFVERNAPNGAPRGFFHFIYQNENSGFRVAREVLLGLQSRRMPALSLGDAMRSAGGLVALAWNRFVRRRLYTSKKTPSHLQLDIEQRPNPDNRITLSDSPDSEGRPRAVVRWGVSTADEEAIRAAAARFFAVWPWREGQFPRLLPAIGDVAAPKPHDVYHPVGTCRMGVDGEAVVDPELRVYGTANLWLVSTAVFPSAGTANPTFSLLCLGAGLADRLVGPAAASRGA